MEKQSQENNSVAKTESVILEYEKRLNIALEYIRTNLDGDLSVDIIARAAHFSPFHFHRIFSAMIGETIHDYVRRLRLEKAALLLLSNPRRSITEIALDCGFASSSTFARAFHQHFGVSATQWRASGGWKSSKIRKENSKMCKTKSNFRKAFPDEKWYYIGEHQQLNISKTEESYKMKVEVKTLPQYRIAYVRQIGYTEEGINQAWETLMRWAGSRDLINSNTFSIGISHDSPEVTPLEKCRYDACITVDESVQPEGQIGVRELNAGKYAVYRFESPPKERGVAYQLLFGEWFPSSVYQPADSPCLEIYLNDPKSHPNGHIIADVCVPVIPL